MRNGRKPSPAPSIGLNIEASQSRRGAKVQTISGGACPSAGGWCEPKALVSAAARANLRAGTGAVTRLNSYEVRRRPIIGRERTGRCDQQGARNEKFVELIANRRGNLNLAKELGWGGCLRARDEHRTPIRRRFVRMVAALRKEPPADEVSGSAKLIGACPIRIPPRRISMRLSNPLMTIATLPSLLLLGSQRTLFDVCAPEASASTMRSSCSIGRGFGGMARRFRDDDSCVVGLGGLEEILCKRQGEVHASVRRGIAREISGMQEYPGPRESFRERHGGIIVFLGTMGCVFAQDAKDAGRGRISGPASAHWGLTDLDPISINECHLVINVNNDQDRPGG